MICHIKKIFSCLLRFSDILCTILIENVIVYIINGINRCTGLRILVKNILCGINLVIANHPNWFDASYISWLSYDSLNIELPDGHLFFAPIINWGRYHEENGQFLMPVSVRLNHAIADGYLVAKVFKLLEDEMSAFCNQYKN